MEWNEQPCPSVRRRGSDARAGVGRGRDLQQRWNNAPETGSIGRRRRDIGTLPTPGLEGWKPRKVGRSTIFPPPLSTCEFFCANKSTISTGFLEKKFLWPARGLKILLEVWNQSLSIREVDHISQSCQRRKEHMHSKVLQSLGQSAKRESCAWKKKAQKRFNSYAKRMGRLDSKRTLLRDVSDFAEYLFQNWNDEDERDPAWFRRPHWSKGAQVDCFRSHEPQWGSCRIKRKGGFDFSSSDDDGVETIFQSTFGAQRSAFRGERYAFRGGGYYYWSFNDSDNFQWRHSSGQANRRSSWNWRDESDYEEEETNSSRRSSLAPERLALGLNASGPLKLDEVKSAYRACALRWHPDRHHGSSKVGAEEKFKHCSAAYKTLCENLAIS